MELPDRYFSDGDGWGESRHVFLRGNDLPERWRGRSEFVVSELGFGTGLNLVALLELAASERRAGQNVPRLVYQSVEWAPVSAALVREHGARWPELAAAAEALADVYDPQPGWNRWELPGAEARVWVGDARALPGADPTFRPADAWFFDGYAPDRGPELWDPLLLRWAYEATVPGGTAATYSAAGVVKRGLRDAGFTVVRTAGWAGKRHMVRALKPALVGSDYL